MEDIENAIRELAIAGEVLRVGKDSAKPSIVPDDNKEEIQRKKETLKELIVKEDCNFDDGVKWYERNYGLKSHKKKNDLLKIHPGHLKFTDVAKTMVPVAVPGLESVQGVIGAIEGEHFNITARCTISGDSERMCDEGARPLHNGLVWIHYALFMEGQDLPFDNSMMRLKGRPAIMKASPSEIFPGMAAAIRWLRIGQRGRFIIPPNAHFGEMGLHEIIPPNTPILLLIHLLRYLDAGALDRYEHLDTVDKKDFEIVKIFVESTNEVAKDHFFRKKISESAQIYKKSIEMLKYCLKTKENKNSIDALMVKTYVNLALCMDKLGNPRDAIYYLDEASVLEDFLKNCKALFLRGRSHLKLSEFQEAKEYLLASFEIQPFNEEIAAELEKLEEMLGGWDKLEYEIGKRMANRHDLVDQGDHKFREQFLSLEDKAHVLRNCDTMIENNVRRFSCSGMLLKEEVCLLEELLKDKGDLELYKPEAK